MSRESESPRSVAALPRPEGLDRFEGMWVAVADGNVVAAAESSHQLALRLHDMDHRKRRQVVIEYVRPTTDSYIVGAGQATTGRIHAFPWREEELLNPGIRILRPTLEVTAALGDLSISTKALIDTGSPRTVLPRGVGDLLGIEFPRYRTDATKKIRLLGGDWAAITETVTLKLLPFDNDLTWEAEVDFLIEEQLSFALLGYEGFLNRWAVTFNAAFGYFVIEPADQYAEDLDPAVLEELRRRYPGLM